MSCLLIQRTTTDAPLSLPYHRHRSNMLIFRQSTLTRARPFLLQHAFSTEQAPAEWRERVQQWTTTLEAAQDKTAPSPAALCDVGYAMHAGAVPSLKGPPWGICDEPNISNAVGYYKASAAHKYSPAAWLLSDVYYYGELNKVPTPTAEDIKQAATWAEKVVEYTDVKEAGDAYVRVKASQRLGIIAATSSSSLLEIAKLHFDHALDLCETHLSTNHPFLLPHDPPGLFPLLMKEAELLEDVPNMAKNLNGFAKCVSPEEAAGEGSNKLQDALGIRNYITSVRTIEGKDKTFASNLLFEGLAKFPGSLDTGNWGITYTEGMFRIYGHPLVQAALKNAVATSSSPPKVLVLGSALGTACVLPALAFGFKAVGYDALTTCIDKSKELASKVKGEAGEKLNKLVSFESGNIFDGETTAKEVSSQISESTVIWSNDFSWSKAQQSEVEIAAFNNLPVGGVLVLYRSPNEKLRWRDGLKIKLPTSWDPELPAYVLIK
jgi:hypothetical protein